MIATPYDSRQPEEWEIQLDLLKQRSEFFPAGRIVPKRIMRITHSRTGKMFKKGHLFTFDRDTWVLRHNNVQFVFNDDSPGWATMRLAGKHDFLNLQGNPYGIGGNWLFVESGRDLYKSIVEKMK